MKAIARANVINGGNTYIPGQEFEYVGNTEQLINDVRAGLLEAEIEAHGAGETGVKSPEDMTKNELIEYAISLGIDKLKVTRVNKEAILAEIEAHGAGETGVEVISASDGDAETTDSEIDNDAGEDSTGNQDGESN